MEDMMPHMTARFRATTLDAIGEISAVGGTLRWKPVRRTLGINAFGVNAYVADAGEQVVEEHDELNPAGGGHEELYVVLAGHARFTIDGEELDAPAGTVVFLPDPAARRVAVAERDGTTVLAVGSDPARLYEPSSWEDRFVAEDQSTRGDHDAAVATLRAALPRHPGDPALHYNLGCYLARGGRHDEALAELRRAADADPDKVRGWADGDADLDPLRAMEGFPVRD
jgi:tetratricopeptide (TPR) repeat protein